MYQFELMREELKELILTNYSVLIKEYDLTFRDISSVFPQYLLYNDKCIVRFTYDMGSVEVSFIDPLVKHKADLIKNPGGFPSGYPVYPVFHTHKCLFPNDQLKFGSNSWELEQQVKSSRDLIACRFTNVLKGDFTWTNQCP
jgi:hypothetical protein